MGGPLESWCLVMIVGTNSKERWNGGKERKDSSTPHQSRFYFLAVVGTKSKERWAGCNDCSRNPAGHRRRFFLVVGNSECGQHRAEKGSVEPTRRSRPRNIVVGKESPGHPGVYVKAVGPTLDSRRGRGREEIMKKQLRGRADSLGR